jgi:hypothetical protein
MAIGMHFASRIASGSSMVSPLARPYHSNGSVAAYLQSQARSPTDLSSSLPDYRQDNMKRLESILQELEDLPIDDDDSKTAKTRSSSGSRAVLEPPPLPNLQPTSSCTTYLGPIAPPTPAESTQPWEPEEPVVRITMKVWDTLNMDAKNLRDKNRDLEAKLVQTLKTQQQAMHHDGDCKEELMAQKGKLEYQNEHNKVQKATMARSLTEKDLQIKQMQLDIDNLKERLETTTTAAKKEFIDLVKERDYLQATLKNNTKAHGQIAADSIVNTNGEVERLEAEVNSLQEALRTSNLERDAALRIHASVGDHKAHAQKLTDQLSHREKLLRSTQEKFATEHTRVCELEDHVEDLQRRLDLSGDFQSKLREVTSERDRFRTKVKHQEKVIEDAQNRIQRASNQGASLRGAAHLVKPQANTKLPALTLGCSECYANNVPCDDKARCRNCTENNENCVRWRCSLKHILGTCPDVPCRFPHDQQGWLLQVEPRPQW